MKQQQEVPQHQMQPMRLARAGEGFASNETIKQAQEQTKFSREAAEQRISQLKALVGGALGSPVEVLGASVVTDAGVEAFPTEDDLAVTREPSKQSSPNVVASDRIGVADPNAGLPANATFGGGEARAPGNQGSAWDTASTASIPSDDGDEGGAPMDATPTMGMLKLKGEKSEGMGGGSVELASAVGSWAGQAVEEQHEAPAIAVSRAPDEQPSLVARLGPPVSNGVMATAAFGPSSQRVHSDSSAVSFAPLNAHERSGSAVGDESNQPKSTPPMSSPFDVALGFDFGHAQSDEPHTPFSPPARPPANVVETPSSATGMALQVGDSPATFMSPVALVDCDRARPQQTPDQPVTSEARHPVGATAMAQAGSQLSQLQEENASLRSALQRLESHVASLASESQGMRDETTRLHREQHELRSQLRGALELSAGASGGSASSRATADRGADDTGISQGEGENKANHSVLDLVRCATEAVRRLEMMELREQLCQALAAEADALEQEKARIITLLDADDDTLTQLQLATPLQQSHSQMSGPPPR